MSNISPAVPIPAAAPAPTPDPSAAIAAGTAEIVKPSAGKHGKPSRDRSWIDDAAKSIRRIDLKAEEPNAPAEPVADAAPVEPAAEPPKAPTPTVDADTLAIMQDYRARAERASAREREAAERVKQADSVLADAKLAQRIREKDFAACQELGLSFSEYQQAVLAGDQVHPALAEAEKRMAAKIEAATQKLTELEASLVQRDQSSRLQTYYATVDAALAADPVCAANPRKAAEKAREAAERYAASEKRIVDTAQLVAYTRDSLIKESQEWDAVRQAAQPTIKSPPVKPNLGGTNGGKPVVPTNTAATERADNPRAMTRAEWTRFAANQIRDLDKPDV